ncbi:MAG: hypothetical protein HQK49_07725 [Oligoflexia bacterium]|nr:hypothetical protein [Oligoflexia bacterium]
MIKKIFKYLFLSLIYLLIYLEEGHACSGLALTLNYPTYNLNANSAPVLDFKVSRKNDSFGCSYFVGISKGRSSDYNRNLYLGNSKLPMQLYKNNSSNYIIKDIPDIRSDSDCITGTFIKKNKILENILTYKTTLSLPANIMLAGTYTESYTVNLYQGTVSSGGLIQSSKTLTYTYNYPTKIDLSLVSSGAPFDLTSTYQNLNFGVLASGQSMSFDIVVLSNAGYNLYLSSTYNGNLKHTNYQSMVNYSMLINNSTINLAGSSSTPVLAASGVGVTANEGQRIPVRVVMGEVKNQLAGQYSDVIFITIATNL